jgi:hypothetical protein
MRIRYQVALGLLGLGILIQVVRSLYFIYLSMGQKNICPRCGALYINLSRRRGLGDLLYHLVGCIPYRCTVCELRFHRPRVQ